LFYSVVQVLLERRTMHGKLHTGDVVESTASRRRRRALTGRSVSANAESVQPVFVDAESVQPVDEDGSHDCIL
jgi:hypothetical protein